MDTTFICILTALAIVIPVLFCLALAHEQQSNDTWRQNLYDVANDAVVPQQKEILRLENVTVIRNQQCVLDKIDLNVYEGEKIAIIGPSGAGKSTLLSCIRGELIPTQGIVVFDKRKMRYNSTALSQHYINVPMIDQSASSLVPFHSVFKNIVKQLLVFGVTQDQASERARRCLRTMKIQDKTNSSPEHLSGGERQRSVVSKALAMGDRVKLLLADEPTSSLDPPLVRDIVKSLTETKFAVIFITHQLEQIMNDVDRILLLYQGKLKDITAIKEKRQCFAELLEQCDSDAYYSGLLRVVAQSQNQENLKHRCVSNIRNSRVYQKIM